jgi:2-hydroxychromene-2-carboxylate isomerase
VPSPTAAFYFDLASPEAYLAAEQALHIFAAAPEPVEWQPILAAELPGHAAAAADAAFRNNIAARATELNLQPLRWPDPFPFDSSLAMRVATYAKSIGRTVPFVQAAFRQCYAGGRSLQDEDSVVIAAAACEMHPKAVLQGAGLRSVATQLTTTTKQAAEQGVRSVPAVLAGGRVFHGERALGEAVEHMRARPRPRPQTGEPETSPFEITTHGPA